MLTRRNALTVVGAYALATSVASLPAIAEAHPDAELLALGERFFELEKASCEADRLRDEAECAARKEYPERPCIMQRVRRQSFEPGVPEYTWMERWGSLKQRSLDQFYGEQLERLTDPNKAKFRAEVEQERDEQQTKLNAYEATCRAIDDRYDVPALESAFEAAAEAQEAAFNTFVDCRATTFDGLAIKLRAVDMYKRYRDEDREYLPDQIMVSVLDDIDRQGVAA